MTEIEQSIKQLSESIAKGDGDFYTFEEDSPCFNLAIENQIIIICKYDDGTIFYAITDDWGNIQEEKLFENGQPKFDILCECYEKIIQKKPRVTTY